MGLRNITVEGNYARKTYKFSFRTSFLKGVEPHFVYSWQNILILLMKKEKSYYPAVDNLFLTTGLAGHAHI